MYRMKTYYVTVENHSFAPYRIKEQIHLSRFRFMLALKAMTMPKELVLYKGTEDEEGFVLKVEITKVGINGIGA